MYVVKVYENEKRIYTLESSDFYYAMLHYNGALANNPKATHTTIEFDGKIYINKRK